MQKNKITFGKIKLEVPETKEPPKSENISAGISGFLFFY